MLFNSFTYLVFLPITVVLYWLLPNSFRKTLLLVASYIFYMNWMPAYGTLILALTVVNYFLGLAIGKHEKDENKRDQHEKDKYAKQRKRLLITGLVFNIGCLCFFKYANFLIDSLFQAVNGANTLIHAGQASDHFKSPALNIILPLGISFFTFEFIHYITDVYRGSKPLRNFRDFALFAAFFPSQIAGPIKRFQDFAHQLEEKCEFKAGNFQAGLFLIFQGLYKKIVLGDNLGQVVSAGFTNINALGALDAWIAVAGFTFQIFFDFSGYTDIGRGSALLFGYKVPENFNLPFLSANLTEFWRRWHISLSTWLRDYLFIPLGGSRVSAMKQRRNVMITMVLGGLWHGAAWHYVTWGAFHGAGLVASKDWHEFVSRVPLLSRLRTHGLWHWTGVLLTLLFMFMAGILFRSENMPQALAIAQKLVAGGASDYASSFACGVTHLFLISTLPVSLSAYCLFLILRACDQHLISSGSRAAALVRPLKQLVSQSLPIQAVAYVALSIVILGFAPSHVAPFIYFQF